MTTILGIVGWPVAHSRSPAMHGAGIAALGLDAAYVPFAVPPARLEAAVDGLRALGVRGFNVTAPHKRAVMPCLDEVGADARAIGAVNTVVLEDDGRLVGHNTDAEGLSRSLLEAGATVTGEAVVVLGAGGAARAATVGLARVGATRITVAARRWDAARALCDELTAHAAGAQLDAASIDEAEDALAGARILVQATSAPLGGGAPARAFAASLPLGALPDGAVVVDLVYAPRRTAVLERAAALGLPTLDGLGMLLHQGAIAFERWLGQPAPLGAMRSALG